ncbi:hypothetical protein JCM11641_004806, partial [Rhodosporidiobolus odoratus]
GEALASNLDPLVARFLFTDNTSLDHAINRHATLNGNPRLGASTLLTRRTQVPITVRWLSATPQRLLQPDVPHTPTSAASPVASFGRKPRGEQRLELLQKDILRLLSRRLPLAQLAALRHRLHAGRPVTRSSRFFLFLLVSLAGLTAAYNFSDPFRHSTIAVQRCATIGYAVARGVMDYKALFRQRWEDTDEGWAQRHHDYEETHWKAARRLSETLRQLGGIYIKLGQHLSTVQLVPLPWSQAMKPLQDQCFPTPLEALQALFLEETGEPMSRFFSSFDPEPIGVASLAQVHRAVDRETGKQVAVKCMHPALEEFAAIDMRTTTFLLGLVKRVFPSFEFTWLGEEMEQNLPLEMDFRHEAANAARCIKDFSDLEKTTLVLPDVLWARKRVMVMEFIQGGRVDDLDYLARHSIDRNAVSREIAEICSRMIYITGFFHADLHGGNLLIRPSQPGTRSPYNFEVVLLDHGLYFDLPTDLRVNYAKFWLSLMASTSPSVEAARRKYAKLVANIDDAHYPLFQAAITGRAALDGASVSGDDAAASGRGSLIELGENTKEEMKLMKSAMVQQEGLMEALFEILRNVPRRMLMLFKVNDLNRALDLSLQTTHSPARIFLIIAQYCNLSIRLDDLAHVPPLALAHRLSSWWRYEVWKIRLWTWIFAADLQAWVNLKLGRGRGELKLQV